MRKSVGGFTIVELLIVIVVIAILAAISMVAYENVQQGARDSVRKSDIAQIAKVLELYHAAEGEYPTGSGSTTINNGWSSTADGSWDNLVSKLSKYGAIPERDPVNTSGIRLTSSAGEDEGFGYAYFSNQSSSYNYCGSGVNQAYILVYRLEAEDPVQTTQGECTVNVLGYFSPTVTSNYRVAK